VSTTTECGLRIGDRRPNTELALVFDYFLDTWSHEIIIGMVAGHSKSLIPPSAKINEALKLTF